MNSEPPYNPLDKLNLGNSIARALLERPVISLTDTKSLVGAGVYAIYYTGNFPVYKPISDLNINDAFRRPIYVGRAIPEGSRKGGLTADAATGKALRERLRMHARSINAVNNLELADFHYRCLVVDDVWIPLGENVLIEIFKPVWNMIVDGLGNNTPGKGREKQVRSAWDTLHPGRKFASKLPEGTLTAADVIAKLEAYFSGRFTPSEPVETDADLEQDDI